MLQHNADLDFSMEFSASQLMFNGINKPPAHIIVTEMCAVISIHPSDSLRFLPYRDMLKFTNILHLALFTNLGSIVRRGDASLLVLLYFAL